MPTPFGRIHDESRTLKCNCKKKYGDDEFYIIAGVVNINQ